MTTLCVGSHGDLVRRLQETLNRRLTPSPKLVLDGAFGNLTRQAVLRFQALCWLVEDGVAGPATQAAVYDREAFAPILHNVPFIPQPTSATCWAASTAMMTNSNVPTVIGRTPSDMIASDGGLLNSSESDQAVVSGTRYARTHGLRCSAPMSWSVRMLWSALHRGPIMFDMLWNTNEYAQGKGSPGHMICVVGIRGDGEGSGRGTTLRIHDPWPPNTGRRYSRGYFKWAQELPTITYRVFEK